MPKYFGISGTQLYMPSSHTCRRSKIASIAHVVQKLRSAPGYMRTGLTNFCCTETSTAIGSHLGGASAADQTQNSQQYGTNVQLLSSFQEYGRMRCIIVKCLQHHPLRMQQGIGHSTENLVCTAN